MTSTCRFMLTVFVVCCGSVFATSAMGQYAAYVLSYNPGSTTATNFVTPSAALGEPSRFTNDSSFPSVVSPFSPPFSKDQVVSIGEGGEITLQLSNYALPQAGGLPELGIFGNVGIDDQNFPNGLAGTPASTFNGIIESPKVEVSADGTTWFSFGSVAIDVPTNGYTDAAGPFSSVPGTGLSDFQQPFAGSLSSFDGKDFSPDMFSLLAGSGGGKWLDISGTGLTKVGYVRFSIADDGIANTHPKFELDGVSVSHSAMGGTVVPEPTALLLAFIAAWGLIAKHRVAQARR